MHMEIFLFSHDLPYATAAANAGLALVVDWETTDKNRRQSGYDTEIDPGTPDLLARMRGAFSGRVVCRIDNRPGQRRQQIDTAVVLGADEVWLPMARSIDEVEECIEAIDRRAGLGVLVETREALDLGRQLDRLPLTRVYVGLNDLRIALGRGTTFDTMVDGTVDAFRADYHGAFGVAAVTLPAAGAPVPQRLLLAEMARLNCSFAIARRAFRRDVPVSRIGETVTAIRSAYGDLLRRNADAIDHDRANLVAAVRALPIS